MDSNTLRAASAGLALRGSDRAEGMAAGAIGHQRVRTQLLDGLRVPKAPCSCMVYAI